MKSLLLICLLTVTTCHAAMPTLTRTYTSSKQLLSTYTIHWYVNQTESMIYLGFQVHTRGWFGFGIAEPQSGSMPGADMMTAYVGNDGVVSVKDRFSTEYSTPHEDTGCHDWQVISGAEADDWTVIEVKRLLDTGDTVQDRMIPPGPVPIVFSHSVNNNDGIDYHGNNRGIDSISFYGPPKRNPNELLTDPTVTIAFPHLTNYTIPRDRTTYMCQSFELPIDQVRHIIAFEPVVKSPDPSMVHHGLVHACSHDSTFWMQYQQPGLCDSPVGNTPTKCQDILFGWARGGDSLFLPSDAGFRVSNNATNDGGVYRILLQIHFDNPNGNVGYLDSSGFKLYMTTNLRPHDAGVLVLGDPSTSSAPIPALSPYTEYEYACSPTCTNMLQTNTLHVFSSFPHMHMRGRSIWTTHWRGGVQLPDAVRTEYFAWTIQKNIPVNYTIIAGDRLHTHCAYDTRTSNVAVKFGSPSDNEMCMDFISYWPKQRGVYECGAIHYEGPVEFNGAMININTNVSACGAGPLVPYEPNNPSQWGFDPSNQRVRRFGNEMTPINTICPSNPTSSTSSSTGMNGGSTSSSSPTSATSPPTSTPTSISNSSSTGSILSSTGPNIAFHMIPSINMMMILMIVVGCFM